MQEKLKEHKDAMDERAKLQEEQQALIRGLQEEAEKVKAAKEKAAGDEVALANIQRQAAAAKAIAKKGEEELKARAELLHAPENAKVPEHPCFCWRGCWVGVPAYACQAVGRGLPSECLCPDLASLARCAELSPDGACLHTPLETPQLQCAS